MFGLRKKMANKSMGLEKNVQTNVLELEQCFKQQLEHSKNFKQKFTWEGEGEGARISRGFKNSLPTSRRAWPDPLPEFTR